MVMVWDPVPAREVVVTFIVDVPEPGAGMDVGLKLTVTPEGWPVADKAIAELKPFSAAVVIVEVPELPLTTVIALGDALMVKLALGGAVTVRVTVAARAMLSPVPVTVIGYVPVAVVEATAMVMIEVPEPGAAMGLVPKLTVTPVGWPVADRVIAELKPPETAVVIVEVPLLPCTTETEVGEAEMVKFGPEDVPARPLIRPDPFGLPQPVSKS